MTFRLSEPTVIRVLAPQHRHLEYELVLTENHGPYSQQHIQDGVIEDHHSGIFAQLQPGDYSLKLVFQSDAQLLQVPCQTIDLEMAMMTIKNAQAVLDDHHKTSRDNAKSSLPRGHVFKLLASGHPDVVYQKDAIKVR